MPNDVGQLGMLSQSSNVSSARADHRVSRSFSVWSYHNAPALGCLTQANGLVGRCLILMGPLLVLFAGVLVTVLAIALLALEFAQSELRDARTRAREESVASHRSPIAPSAVDLRPLLIQAVAAVGEDVARPIRLA